MKQGLHLQGDQHFISLWRCQVKSDREIVDVDIVSVGVVRFFDDVLEDGPLIQEDDAQFLDAVHFQEELVFGLRNNFVLCFVLFLIFLFHFLLLVFVLEHNAIIILHFEHAVAVVLDPPIFHQDFEEVVQKIEPAVLERQALLVLKIDAHIFSQVPSAMYFNLQRINDSWGNFRQHLALLLVFGLVVLLARFVTVER